MPHGRALVGFACGFFLFNLVLKLPGAGQASLWLDEAFTIFVSRQSIPEIVRASASDENPPLYFLIMHGWLALFGTSELAARSFSTLCHATTAAVLVFWSRLIGRRAALLASLLLTVSTIQTYYAQEARCFALVSLLGVLSFHVHVMLLRRPACTRAALLALLNALLLYTHYLAIFVPVTQVVVTFVTAPDESRRVQRFVLASMALTVLAVAPWLPVILANVPTHGSYWLGRPSLGTLWAVLTSFANRQPALFYGTFVLAIPRVRGWFDTPPLREAERRMLRTFLLWGLVPVTGAYATGQLVPSFTDRYVLFASLGMMLAVACCVASVRMSRRAFAVACAILVGGMGIKWRVDEPRPADWRSAVEIARAHTGPDAALIVSPSAEALPFAYYFDRSLVSQYAQLGARLAAAGVTVFETVQAARLPPVSRLVWLRGGGHALDAGEGDADGFLPPVTTRLLGIDVVVLERRGSPGSEFVNQSPD